MAKIHPTALVDPAAAIDDSVEIGPGCVIEADVRIGPGCVLRENVIVRRYTTLGANNTVDAFTVLGGAPQDFKFDPATVSSLRIGDGNVFREHCTVSRATGEGNETVIGNNTYWMAGAHAGHNAVVRDNVILVNQSAIAGHTEVGERAILSAHAVLHQFTWMGDMAMIQGNGGSTTHVPPYVICAGMNQVIGLNLVGLRRAPHITPEDLRQIKEAFRITYRRKLPKGKVIEALDACTDFGAPAAKFRDFVRRTFEAQRPWNRGLCPIRYRIRGSEVEAVEA